jgi:membrane protease YdiL (CAAX protease family)
MNANIDDRTVAAAPSPSRWRRVLELTLAVGLVLGHRVFHVVPGDETWYLLGMGLISIGWFGPGFRGVGFRRPASWRRTIASGVAIGVALQLLSTYVTEPLLARITHTPIDVASLKPYVGSVKFLLLITALGWTAGAFREEFTYRAYLMTRVTESVGDRRVAAALALLFSSALFAAGHSSQGLPDALDAGVHGLVFGVTYLATGRNIWMPLIAHGATDTIGGGMVYFGLF